MSILFAAVRLRLALTPPIACQDLFEALGCPSVEGTFRRLRVVLLIWQAPL